MKHTISIIMVLLLSSAAFSQIRNNPKLTVQKDDPHFAVLAEYKAQIVARYNKGKLIIPTFRSWLKVRSKSASELFPQLSFYSISWSESLHPNAKKQDMSLALGLEKTVGVNRNSGKIEVELLCCGNYEAFGQLLVRHKAVLQNVTDAKRVWIAFCDTHHRLWRDYPIRKISETEWRLGISSYDQTVSTTNKTKTMVTRTHYMQIMVDVKSKQILSWESKVDTSNKRTLPKE